MCSVPISDQLFVSIYTLFHDIEGPEHNIWRLCCVTLASSTSALLASSRIISTVSGRMGEEKEKERESVYCSTALGVAASSGHYEPSKKDDRELHQKCNFGMGSGKCFILYFIYSYTYLHPTRREPK